jgi:hypothetical protein
VANKVIPETGRVQWIRWYSDIVILTDGETSTRHWHNVRTRSNARVGSTVISMKSTQRVSFLASGVVLFSSILLFSSETAFAQGLSIVEIGNIQFSKSLSGIVLAPDDSRLKDVEVVEVSSDWHTTIRVARTDSEGRWSLPANPNQRVYFLRFVTKQCCFNEVRCKVSLSKGKGKELSIKLPLST